MAKGWSRESKRHSLAASGVKTAVNEKPKRGVIYSCPTGFNKSFFPKDDEQRMNRFYQLEESAKQAGLGYEYSYLYALFMMKAFPGESANSGYANEWIERVKKEMNDPGYISTDRGFDQNTSDAWAWAKSPAADKWHEKIIRHGGELENKKTVAFFKRADAAVAADKAKRLVIGDWAHEKYSGNTGEVVGIFQGGKIAFRPDGSPPDFYVLIEKNHLEKDKKTFTKVYNKRTGKGLYREGV